LVVFISTLLFLQIATCFTWFCC